MNGLANAYENWLIIPWAWRLFLLSVPLCIFAFLKDAKNGFSEGSPRSVKSQSVIPTKIDWEILTCTLRFIQRLQNHTSRIKSMYFWIYNVSPKKMRLSNCFLDLSYSPFSQFLCKDAFRANYESRSPPRGIGRRVVSSTWTEVHLGEKKNVMILVATRFGNW